MNKISSEQVLDILPQTQCMKCGYASCRDYADAIITGAPINRCPTGGKKGIWRLARLTGKPFAAPDLKYGQERPREIALVDETLCIGCALCLKACPVDAIIGASGFAHTILQKKCTGCDLCLPACPVDCIIMKNASGSKTGWDAWSPEQATRARHHHELRMERLKREEAANRQRPDKKAAARKKKNTVQAALLRARAKAAGNTAGD